MIGLWSGRAVTVFLLRAKVKLTVHVKSFVRTGVPIIVSSTPLFSILPTFCVCEVKSDVRDTGTFSKRSSDTLLYQSKETFNLLLNTLTSRPILSGLFNSQRRSRFPTLLGALPGI